MQDVWARLGPQGLTPVVKDEQICVEETKPTARRLQLPFWLALAGPISGTFLVASTLRFLATTKIHEGFMIQTVQKFDAPIHFQQNANRDRLAEYTVLNYDIVFGHVQNHIMQYVTSLPNRAVDGVWKRMLAEHTLASAMTGATSASRNQLAYAMWRELRASWLPNSGAAYSTDLLLLRFTSGAFCGVAGSGFWLNGEPLDSSTFRFLESGPVPGSGSNSPMVLDRFTVDQDTGQILRPAGTVIASSNSFEFVSVQAQLANQSKGGRTREAWSGIYKFAGSPLLLSWTKPVAYCKNYSCVEGVLAASLLLRSISDWTTNEWRIVQRKLAGFPFNFNITNDDSAIFIVQQTSAEQKAGILLGWSGPGGPEDTVVNAVECPQAIVTQVSTSLLAKFGSWDAEPLMRLDRHPLLARCENGKLEEGKALLNESWVPVCSLIATRSISLDSNTRWLVVQVLPIQAFRKSLDEATDEVNKKILGAKSSLTHGV